MTFREELLVALFRSPRTEIEGVDVDDIRYLKAENGGVTIRHKGFAVTNESLNSLETNFPGFLRISRNTLVNPRHIRAQSQALLSRNHNKIIVGAETLEVSRRQVPIVRNWLRRNWRGMT